MKGRARGALMSQERSIMDDNRIIELLFERAEGALDEVFHKYSRLYRGIIREMLSDECDIDECANDVLLAVWNSIPPKRPDCLGAYVCRIARHIGINRLKYNTRQKRSVSYTVMLSEIEECIPQSVTFEESTGTSETVRTVLGDFLRDLDPVTRILFIRRYIYLESVTSLAERFEISENNISVKLFRARRKLKKALEKEEIGI